MKLTTIFAALSLSLFYQHGYCRPQMHEGGTLLQERPVANPESRVVCTQLPRPDAEPNSYEISLQLQGLEGSCETYLLGSIKKACELSGVSVYPPYWGWDRPPVTMENGICSTTFLLTGLSKFSRVLDDSSTGAQPDQSGPDLRCVQIALECLTGVSTPMPCVSLGSLLHVLEN